MAYPILAAKNTWWAPTVSTVKSSSITEIELMDSYTPDSSVTVVDSWDASAAKDGSITCYVIGTKLIIAGNGSGKIAANEDSSFCFSDSNGKNIFVVMTTLLGTNFLDMSNAINMFGMFFRCEALTAINVSTWNISNSTNISGLFARCFNLASIEGISNWNTSNVTSMQTMFAFMNSLNSIDLSNWDVSNVTTINKMFYFNTVSSVGDLSNWNVSKVTNMAEAFLGCNSLTSIGDLSNWNISSVTNIAGLFQNCQSLTSVGNLSNWDVSKCINTSSIFAGCSNLTEVGDLSSWNLSNSEYVSAMFANCFALTFVGDLSNWNISNSKSTELMFSRCSELISIGELSNWNMSNVTNMSAMFQDCPKLTGIGDLANWDTSSVTDMSFMFYGCSSLKEIDVSNWDVSKVTILDHFAAHAGLRRKGIENWKTTSLVNANAAFHNCAEEELDLSGWDVSKVQFFCQMFENSPNLKRIKGLEKWNTSAGLGFDGMFERCSKLEEVDLSSFDTSKAKNGVDGSTNGHKTATLNNMFLSCNNLKKVKVGPNFSINGDGSNTTAANKAILPTPSTDYIEGADGMWYAFNGEPYAPNAIKDKTAETYFASYALCADQDIIVKNGSMIDTAKAIREKNGTTNHYTPAQFGAAIRALN